VKLPKVKISLKNILEPTVITLLIIFGYLGYQYSLLKPQIISLENKIGELETELGNTRATLKVTENEKIGLANDLDFEQQKVGVISERFEEVAGVVGDLEKLSKTDPELLQKYSKVFFLNEHYIPQRLSR